MPPLENEPSPFAEPTGDTSGIDVDSLMEGIDSSLNREIPMSAPTAEPAAAVAAQAPASEIEFDWKGKNVKVPFGDDRLKQWASQGYDYAQRMEAFKAQQAEFQKQSESTKALEARYRQVEEYVEKNPEWWKRVNDEYQRVQSQQQGFGDDPNNPLAQKLNEYGQKLGQVEQFIQSKQAEEQAQRRQAEDTRLDGEIKSIRDQYANLDWKTPDAEGKDLEFRVLRHANEIGTNNFQAAFRDYMHDHIVKLTAEQAKENVVKERQKQSKLGLLGKSQAPAKGLTEARDIKSKSYDELEREGLEELGIA